MLCWLPPPPHPPAGKYCIPAVARWGVGTRGTELLALLAQTLILLKTNNEHLTSHLMVATKQSIFYSEEF
jgi:hypothetical protein